MKSTELYPIMWHWILVPLLAERAPRNAVRGSNVSPMNSAGPVKEKFSPSAALGRQKFQALTAGGPFALASL